MLQNLLCVHKKKHRHSQLVLLWIWHYTIVQTSESITLQKCLSTKTTDDLSNHRLCMWSDLCPGWNARLKIQCHCGSTWNKQKNMKQTPRNSLLIHRIWTTCPACVLLPNIHTHTRAHTKSVYTITTKMEKQQIMITWKKKSSILTCFLAISKQLSFDSFIYFLLRP